jgi:beta-N-acetylhexosaminidase
MGSPRDPAAERRRDRRRERRRALVRRRRAVALAGLAAIVILIALLIGDDPEEANPLDRSAELASLSDAELAGQRLIAGFDGTRPPRGLRRMVGRGELAGIILFADNVAGREQLAGLIAGLEAIERPQGLADPLLVTVDQEGGRVKRLGGPPRASAVEMGERGAEYARRQGELTARSLRSVGINLNLAPVLDLEVPGRAMAAEERTFGATPEEVIAVGLEGFTAGQRAGGVGSTAKHFPGLGSAEVNTDDAAQRIRTPAATLAAEDMRPFEAFAAAGGEAVMPGFAVYPALSRRPAAFASSIVEGELRERLGFEGVAITDALDAAAARAFGPPDRVALAAAAAGNDLLLYPDWRQARDAGRTLRRALAAGRLERERFQRSVGRVLELRARLAG